MAICISITSIFCGSDDHLRLHRVQRSVPFSRHRQRSRIFGDGFQRQIRPGKPASPKCGGRISRRRNAEGREFLQVLPRLRAREGGKLQAMEKETTNPQEHEKQAARYFRLALRYAITGSEPLVLVVMGRIGTGKTTVAKQLASELDWPIFSSDEIRKTLAGVPVTEQTASEMRDKVYSAPMTEKTYKQLIEGGLAAVGRCSRGRRPRPAPRAGVILDAIFSTRTLRKLLRKECEKADVRFQFVELDVDLEEIKKRLKARDDKAAEISDARLEDFEKLSAAYEPPSELAPDLIKISSSGAAFVTVKAILLQLAKQQSVEAHRRADR